MTMEMITKELAIGMNEDGTDTVYTTGDGKATPFLPADEMMPVVRELRAENKSGCGSSCSSFSVWSGHDGRDA